MSFFAKRYTEELINPSSLQFLFRHNNYNQQLKSTIEIRMTSIGNIQLRVSQIKFHQSKSFILAVSW